MSLIAQFGTVLMCAATLRLLDIAWPTTLLPWWFYGAELCIGVILLESFRP